MPSHILVNGLGLTYKSTMGISTATIPDVCKTPSPGGPVPIPYPNFAQQSSLKGGTTTVKAKGKMIAVKGSQYSRSNGDEPGTAGGVKSNVNMKATDWITYSFDVKMDGKNACRHTDKKFHNNQNTVDLQGNIDPADMINFRAALCQALKKCTTQVDASNPKPLTKKWCGKNDGANQKARGNAIDKCARDKIQGNADKSPTEFSERVNTTNEPIAYGSPCKPDVMLLSLPGPGYEAVYDFKTSCPPQNYYEPNWPVYGPKSGFDWGNKRPTYKAENPRWHDKTQQQIYETACEAPVEMIHENTC